MDLRFGQKLSFDISVCRNVCFERIHWRNSMLQSRQLTPARCISCHPHDAVWTCRVYKFMAHNWFPVECIASNLTIYQVYMDRVKRIWYLSPMRAAKVQASLRIRAVSPEPSLLAHTSSESRGTFRQKTRSLAPLNGWTCAVEICHDGMLEDTNSLDGAQFKYNASVALQYRIIWIKYVSYFVKRFWCMW